MMFIQNLRGRLKTKIRKMLVAFCITSWQENKKSIYYRYIYNMAVLLLFSWLSFEKC